MTSRILRKVRVNFRGEILPVERKCASLDMKRAIGGMHTEYARCDRLTLSVNVKCRLDGSNAIFEC